MENTKPVISKGSAIDERVASLREVSEELQKSFASIIQSVYPVLSPDYDRQKESGAVKSGVDVTGELCELGNDLLEIEKNMVALAADMRMVRELIQL